MAMAHGGPDQDSDEEDALCSSCNELLYGDLSPTDKSIMAMVHAKFENDGGCFWCQTECHSCGNTVGKCACCFGCRRSEDECSCPEYESNHEEGINGNCKATIKHCAWIDARVGTRNEDKMLTPEARKMRSANRSKRKQQPGGPLGALPKDTKKSIESGYKKRRYEKPR